MTKKSTHKIFFQELLKKILLFNLNFFQDANNQKIKIHMLKL